MKKTPHTFIPAGAAHKSSELSSVRRRVLRGIVAHSMFCGLPIMLKGTQANAATPETISVCICVGDALARYGFGDGHPLGVDRQGAFLKNAENNLLLENVQSCETRQATIEELGRFHTEQHINKVLHAERDNLKFLDEGDTPVFPGVFEASAAVVGSALEALASVMNGKCGRTFQPIGGLHHARRNGSAGFCVFNDIGVVIETLRRQYGIRRIAYVDIDVHHGDGIFYSYEDDPDLIIADIHEDGQYLYPGTGRPDETGKGSAKGTKLNVALKPGAGNAQFLSAWPRVEAHISKYEPEFVLFQCGADGLKGDPLAHLTYTPAVHGSAAKSLRTIADRFSKGRWMAFGGGGYNRQNLAEAWTAVLRAMMD